jgi:MoaA/NifB/PqqE/SkfB family radical SAM enzyme
MGPRERGGEGESTVYNVPKLIADDAFRAALRDAVEAPHAPTLLRCAKIKLTPRCNLRCVFCNYWRMGAERELPTERWLAVLDELAALSCAKVHFSGGEPMLRGDVVALVERCTSLGMRANLTTNATLLEHDKDRARALMEAGVNGVSVSIDGPTARAHDGIRGIEGAFARTMRGLRNLLAARDKVRPKATIRVNTVLTRRNYSRLPEIVKLVGEMGVDAVDPMPVDERGERRVRLSKAQVVEYNDFIAPQVLELRRRYGMPCPEHLLYPFGRDERAPKLARRGEYARRYYKHPLCYVPWLHTFIAWNGDVSLCCMARGKTEPFANVAETPVAEAWAGECYAAIREAFLVERPKVCRRCDNFLSENRLLEAALQPSIETSADAASAAPFA